MQATLTTLACLSAPMDQEIVEITPIWQEDPHFIHYRALVISCALDNIQDMIVDLHIPQECEILDKLDLVRINLGQPKIIPSKKITDCHLRDNCSNKR